MNIQTKSIAAACILLLVAGCGKSSYPVVTADEDHHFVLGVHEPPPYEIMPAAGIHLDISHFQFMRNGASFTPDTVQVWNHSKRYRLAGPIAPDMILDASTLTNATGTESFPGFESGDHVMIAVGVAHPTDLTPEYMSYDWEALVLVK